MANRILIAEIFQDDSGNCYLNMSPNKMRIHTGDNVAIIVRQGNVPSAQSSQVAISFNFTSGSCPFSTTPSPSGNINEVISIGAIQAQSGDVEYTITVSYGGNDYTEDPKISINN
ncbi:hypothetical protein [Marinoscillum furvescens]|uniref:Uncharacterized protein n=1 Tax=Marinoscillum furvescens DSM 4134 TaxID=1122208 RepID=A0A3D9L028_MARFU|nr:hypothetical protein [Marinoscillum furvescens]RED95263.1 hypothetical protein C7460_11840 [Marinoscillum furvescens DSM 4134]